MIFGGQTTTTTLSIIFGIGLALVSGSNSQDLQLHNTFSPKVEWSCWRKQLHVSITSNTPFHGLATTTKANSSRSSMPSQCSIQGNGSTVTLLVIDWHEHGWQCGVQLNKEEGRISVQLEVHEHPFILMSHDHFYNISCQLTEESDMTTTLPPTTKSLLEADGLLVVQQQAAPQAVTSVTPPSSIDQLELQLQVVEQVQQQNTSSPFHNNTPQPQSIVEFGQPYQLIGSIQPSSVPFLVHSCWASPADLSTLQQQKILLIDEQGCSVDSHILTELKYLEDRVFATIPCMFQFPKARTVRFECSYAVCEPGAIKCRPDCRRTTSASNGRKETEDEMEMLTELLGSGLGENEEEEPQPSLPLSNHTNKSTSSRQASVVVHVIQRREATENKPFTDLPPVLPNGVDPGASSPGCIAPADMMLLYKLCIGLCFLFVLGCCCNIIFCCMSRNVGWSPKHNNKKKQNKRLAISTTGSFQHQRPFSALTTTTSTLNPHGHKNEYWIQDTGREQNEPSFYSSHYGELPVNTTTDNGNNRRNSLTSYASVKQRGNRLQDSVHTTHFRLSNSGSDGVSIRPYGPPPSTSPSANSGALRSTIYDQSSTYHPPNSTTFHTNDPTFSSSTSGSVASSMLAEEQEMGDKHQDGQTQEQGVGGPHRVAPSPTSSHHYFHHNDRHTTQFQGKTQWRI